MCSGQDKSGSSSLAPPPPSRKYFVSRQYGDLFTFKLPGRNITVALGPKGSNLVFNGKLAQVSAEEAYTHLTTPVFGKEVVYDVPNAVFMEQKKLVKVGLSTENFRVYVPQITSEVVEFFKKEPDFAAFRKEQAGTQGTVDIFKTMSEITILTASRTLQGKEVRDNLDKSFADLYHDLDLGFNPLNFVIPNLPIPSNFKRDRAQKRMSDFYLGIIQKRRQQGGTTETDHDMIASLMDQTYKNGRSLRDIEIAHIMIALLMAGQHTSSATASWAMLRLASKPEYIKELYEEQKQVYGDAEGGFRPLDYETQKSSVPFLDCVIRETLRMHPPIHSIMRKVLSDIPVPPTLASIGGPSKSKGENATYVIPAGHYVMAAPGVSQVDPFIWKNSTEFDPHRWSDKDGVVQNDDKEEEQDYGWGSVKTGGNSPYLPFGAGRHRCIGEQFAYLQLGTILANFVRRFDWKLETKFPDPDYTVSRKREYSLLFYYS
jgi:sterol 14-demethylase